MPPLAALLALFLAPSAGFAPAHVARTRHKPVRAAADGDKVASVQLPLSERFGLVYTCGRCETRNAISVSRIAWNEGVVIGKCLGCGARHMLADNTGLTDETNSTRFSNAVNDAIARGEEVRRLGLNDAAALADAGVELLPGGNISLIAREGERIEKTSDDDEGRVIATRREAVIIAPEEEPKPPPPPEAPPVEIIDDVSPAPPPQALPAAAPEVVVPPGPEPGDVLRCDTFFGVVHVRVPEGAAEGATLRLEGVVEVGIPPGAAAGEVLAVALPDATTVAVELRPEDTELIAVAFPVTIV